VHRIEREVVNLIFPTMPEDDAAFIPWLERVVIGPDVTRLAMELEVIHDVGASRSLVDILGDDLPGVLESGLSALGPEKLRALLHNPRCLIELQERALVEGGPHWSRRLREDASVVEAAERIRLRLERVRRGSAWWRRHPALALAALVLLAVGASAILLARGTGDRARGSLALRIAAMRQRLEGGMLSPARGRVLPRGDVDAHRASGLLFVWRPSDDSPAGAPLVVIRPVSGPPGSDQGAVRLPGHPDRLPLSHYVADDLAGENAVLVVWDLGRGEDNPSAAVPMQRHPAWPAPGCPPAISIRLPIHQDVDQPGWSFDWRVSRLGSSGAEPDEPCIFRLVGPSRGVEDRREESARARQAALLSGQRLLDAWEELQAMDESRRDGAEWLEAACEILLRLEDRGGAACMLERLEGHVGPER
jgi:hypothetical protein